MSGKGKKQDEQRSPSPPKSLQQPSSSRVQRSPPQATSSGEGRKKGNSSGGATSKPEGAGCSLCCVVLLSVLVAVAAVAGYAAFVAFPTESEQLLREIDSHVRRIVGNLDDFVKTKLDRILNRGPQAAEEKSPETQKSSDANGHTDHGESDEGSVKEERKEYDPHGEHGSGNVEEFDHVEAQGKVGNIEETLDNAGIDFEPETLVFEKEDLGGEMFEQGVREVAVDDDDAEFEGKIDEELEEDAGEEELEDPQDDPSHRWETEEVPEGAIEDAAEKQFEKSVSEDGLGVERHVAPELEEEVSEQEDTREPRVTSHQALHPEPLKAFTESVATETPEPIEEAPAGTLLNVTPERTTEEVETREIPPLEQKVPVQGAPEEVTSNQAVSGDEAEVLIPNEELLPLQEISSEE